MKNTVLYQASPSKNKKSTKTSNSKSSTNSSKTKEMIGATFAEAFQQRAFELREPGIDFDPTAEPQTGEEYLMHMHHERRQHPLVMVRQPKRKVTGDSDAAAAAAVENEDVRSTDELQVGHMRPTKEWKEAQLASFFDLRDRICVLRLEFVAAPNSTNQLEPALAGDVKEWKSFCINHQPLLSTILHLNQRTLEQLIGNICEWLETEEENMSTEQQLPSTSTAAAVAAINDKPQILLCCHLDLANNCHWVGSWLYAALACLHMPLEPDLHSTLRTIARIFIRLRGQLQDEEIQKAVPYNLFICLIAKAFGQLDFEEQV